MHMSDAHLKTIKKQRYPIRVAGRDSSSLTPIVTPSNSPSASDAAMPDGPNDIEGGDVGARGGSSLFFIDSDRDAVRVTNSPSASDAMPGGPNGIDGGDVAVLPLLR